MCCSGFEFLSGHVLIFRQPCNVASLTIDRTGKRVACLCLLQMNFCLNLFLY